MRAIAALVPVLLVLAACESDPARRQARWTPPVAETPEMAPVETTAQAPAPPAPPAAERLFTNVKLKISGLTCPYSCVREVRAMLEKVPGVIDVVIDFESSSALVSVRPGTDPDSLLAGLHAPYAGRIVQ